MEAKVVVKNAALMSDLREEFGSELDVGQVHDNLERVRYNLATFEQKSRSFIWFSEMSSAHEWDTVIVADRTAAWAAADLGIDKPRVRWFLESSEPYAVAGKKSFQNSPGLVGCITPPDIWLHYALLPREAVDVAAHECLHLSGEPSESKAFDYGKLTQLRLWGALEAVGGSAAVWIHQAHEVAQTLRAQGEPLADLPADEHRRIRRRLLATAEA